MHVRLQIVGGPDDGHAVEVDRWPLAIGRSPSAGLTIADRWASRLHCELRLDNGVVTLCDLDSRHGTLLNGQPVRQSKLQAGDRVSIGLTTLLVSVDASTAELPARFAARRQH
jgi:pSer/pThr/pTyr-binding forkhead associated (FHA) protein